MAAQRRARRNSARRNLDRALGAAGGVEVGLTEANAGYLVALGGAFGLIIRLGAESARIGGHSIPCERSPGCVCSERWAGS